MNDETDTMSEVALVRYVEAQPDPGPHRPAMPAHYRIEFADGTFWAIAANFLIRQGAPKPQEAQIAAQEPAGATQGGSGDSSASRGLGERLRAADLIPSDKVRAFADEADRLEQERDGARIKGAQWKARYEETRDANRRVLAVAQWFRDQGQVGYARKVEEAVAGVGNERDPECPCAACDPGCDVGFGFRMASRMSVCPDCGNKRCPKAANHAVWQCSGSNEVGQVGVRIVGAPTTENPFRMPEDRG